MRFIIDDEFKSMVDELRTMADKDTILKIAMDWVDKTAKERGVDFYDMFFLVLQRSVAEQKAKEWMKER